MITKKMKITAHKLLRLSEKREAVIGLLPAGSRGAEIGVWKGAFAERLLAKARPAELLLVDPWEHSGDAKYQRAWHGKTDQTQMDAIHDQVVARFAGDPRVRIMRKNSVAAAADVENRSLDWVYLDADYSYEAAQADIAAWSLKIRPGGVFAGDDYRDGGWFDGGVKRAVDEYCEASQLKLLTTDASQFAFQVPGVRP